MEALKKKRATIKSIITRIFNYCDNSDLPAEGVLARLEKIETYFGQFESVQSEIEQHESLTAEQFELEISLRHEVEEKYYAVKALGHRLQSNSGSQRTVNDNGEQPNNLTNAIETLARNQDTLGSIIERLSSPVPSNVQANVNSVNEQSSIRLPRITLPDFDGSYINWVRFRDLFVALVHEKVNVSNVEKFEYLLSHVKGDALSLVKHLSPSNENYLIAWNLIKTRYDNDQVIKRNYIKLLFDQPNMKGPFVVELKRLINTTNECTSALETMNEQVSAWDCVLIFHLERKLDVDSQTLWCRSATEKATFAEFKQFLEKRLRELENLQPNKMNTHHPSNRHRVQAQVHTASVRNCPLCQQNHLFYSCNKFKALSVNDRIIAVRDNRACFKCLQYDHMVNECTKSGCRVCNGKHNSLLHKADKSRNNNVNSVTLAETNTANVNTVYANLKSVTLLPTAIALILGADNNYHPCRILLDTGAQTSLISESCLQRLKLKRAYDNTMLCGVGNDNKNYTKGKVDLIIKSQLNSTIIKTPALCLSKLTQLQPAFHISSEQLEFFKELELADRNCCSPNVVDVILGANVFSEWFLNRQKVHPSGSPSALETIFGWVIIGKIAIEKTPNITIAHTFIDISAQLQQFWKIEEIEENKQHLTDEEQKAELFYKSTVQRNHDGRYVVRLPFKADKCSNIDTKAQAMKRLSNMENRFANSPELYEEYKKFMDEYIQLDHMEAISKNKLANYHLPHHAVLKPQSTTTKLRVVFDGSAKGVNGESLNDQLLIGPTVQNDIFTILLQFRKHQIGLSADIEKMYRQILVHPDDRAYQCILWRKNKEQVVSTFELKTVTYGTSAAPFLACRTIKQIANDNEEKFPKLANIINECFYVDDLMFSTPSVSEAIDTRLQLCNIFSSAGMHLRKWSTSSGDVLETIDRTDRENDNKTVIDETQTVKTLGLYWNTTNDMFKYSVSIPDKQANVTKRIVLSIISKIYDPLGWAAPVVITLKIFMQRIWLRGLEWDMPLDKDLQQQWDIIHSSMPEICDLQIPRWLNYVQGCRVQLHGFADASELAYAAAVYLKVIHDNGSVTTNLVATKTRVAPVKQVTLPRLELCACHLLTKLLIKINSILKIDNTEIHGWTDSTIVLAWLSDHPRKWKNFIANRTSYIIGFLPANQWHHISSSKNPADLATRGLVPNELKQATLWWHGPTILKENSFKHVEPIQHECPEMEIRKKIICHVKTYQEKDIFHLYSNFVRLLRITAYICRFRKNCKLEKSVRQSGWITSAELKYAHDILVKRAQEMDFSKEIQLIVDKKQLMHTHKLSALNPFIDNSGLLRVGGRLVNANISFDQKHPLILHKDNILTQLIVRYYHLKHLHAGPRQLQYLIGIKYWIPSCTCIIKRCVYKCTTCMRHRKKNFEQQMGNVPKHRLEEALPFQNVGTDFAGPLTIRAWKGRGSKQHKCWIALFICLTTKAMHLELVTELSTNAFLATLRRFVSRRGKPAHMFSDNGTNFIGCNKKLKDLVQFMLEEKTQHMITKETSELGIQWHFSPPSGPNFGGIWEAGVKSVKYHLYRVLGNTSATYEELITVLCQIESCLNSRPLSAKFEGDTDPLTPSHFLLLKAMQALPDEKLLEIKSNRLNRWQYLQQLVQSFWRKWSVSYLSTLQTRQKWKLKSENLKVNDIVILKDESSPPNKWAIARIIETHPGQDGLVRVVTIKTAKGIYKRPITKLCPLIVD